MQNVLNQKLYHFGITYISKILISNKLTTQTARKSSIGGGEYSYLSNKRGVANNRRVWRKYLNLINKGSGTNEWPEIFVTLYEEAFENS